MAGLPVRHTRQCDEARACGHPRTFCVCTGFQRAHERWLDLKEAIERDGPVTTDPADIDAFDSTLTLLDALHRAIIIQHDEELPPTGGRCAECRKEDGP